MKVFLGGEGRHELGDWAADPRYRSSTPEPGVVEALLRRVASVDVEVVGAIRWKDIRKYRAGECRQGEERNVRGLVLHAREAGAGAVAFTRDRDGDTDRERAVAKAVERLEAWRVALRGGRGSESLRRPETEVAASGRTTTRDFVEDVERADLQNVPDDAHSIRQWLRRAREALG